MPRTCEGNLNIVREWWTQPLQNYFIQQKIKTGFAWDYN